MYSNRTSHTWPQGMCGKVGGHKLLLSSILTPKDMEDMCFSPFDSGQALWLLWQQHVAEMILCKFLCPGFKRLAVTTSNFWHICSWNPELPFKNSDCPEATILWESNPCGKALEAEILCEGRDQRTPRCRYMNKESHPRMDPPAPGTSVYTTWIRDKSLSQALPKFLTCTIMSKRILLF